MSNDVLKMMEQDFEDTIASSVEKIDQKGLTTVAELARQIRDEELYIDDLETDLKAAKKDCKLITPDSLFLVRLILILSKSICSKLKDPFRNKSIKLKSISTSSNDNIRF